MRHSVIIGFLFLAGLAITSAQEKQRAHETANNKTYDDRQQVKLDRSVVIPTELSGLLLDPYRCDGDGNIYFRRVDLDSGQRDPIKKVNVAGELKATYDVLQAGNDFVAHDYFVSEGGELTLVGYRQGEHDILGTVVATYGEDGTMKSTVKLDAPRIVPSTIGVFENGSFLITGLRIPNRIANSGEGAPTLHEPYTAIFKDDGTLIKELTFKEDGQIEGAIQSHDQSFVGDQGAQVPFTGGTITHGRDGNLYITRRTSPLVMYAISPAGKVQKTIKVIPPEHGMIPNAVVANGGTVAVLFASGISGPRQLVLADQKTGEVRNAYSVEGKLGVALACYTPENFVFLGTEKGKMTLQIATVQ